MRRTLRVVRRYWRVLTRRFEVWSSPARRAWRRSLQLRVVALTLVASSLLVGAFGWFIADRSAKILLNRAQDEVQVSIRNKVAYAEQQLTVNPAARDPKLPNTFSLIVNQLADGDPTESGGSIVSMRAGQFPELPAVTSSNVDTDQLITPELSHEVSDEKKVARQIVTARLDGHDTK